MICKKNIAAAAAILFMMMALLTACRSSPVLMETLYQQQASEVDENQNALDPDDEGQEDSQFDNEKRDDADTQRDADPNRGINDENNQGEADEAIDVEQSDTQNLQNYAPTTVQPSAAPSSSPAPASSVSPETNTEPASAVQAEQEGDTSTEGGDTSSEGGDNPDSDSPQDTSPDTSEDTSTQPPDDPDPRTRDITDESGEVVKVPQDVSKVTAVGAAAQLVEIAGEDGTLLGTNSDLLNNSLAQLAFSDYSTIQSWWSGDGSGPADNFDAILATSPEVCFVISGQNTFTYDQLAQLDEQQIAVVTLYPFSSFDNLKNNMKIVGEVLTRDDYDAARIADSYCNWVDDILNQAEEKANGYSNRNEGAYLSSLYIVGWDDGAAYSVSGTNGNALAANVPDYGYGLAYSYGYAHRDLVTDAMNHAGLNNRAMDSHNILKNAEYLYVTPYLHQFLPSVTGNLATYFDGSWIYSGPEDPFTTVQSSEIKLGNESYPAVVAASQEIADKLSNNYFWQFHGSSTWYLDGFAESYLSGLDGQPEIYVNPQGMLNWMQGSAESPLESLWLACMYSDNSDEDAWEAMVEFYYEFFGAPLDDSHRQQIFGE